MPEPAPIPASAEPAPRQFFSTKLHGDIQDIHEDQEPFDSPSNHWQPRSPHEPPSHAFAWFRSRVLTPARDQLRRVSARPMVESLQDIRSSLRFGILPKTRRNPSPSFIDRGPAPIRDPAALSKGASPPSNAHTNKSTTKAESEAFVPKKSGTAPTTSPPLPL